jgi:type II secretory pathway component PulC
MRVVLLAVAVALALAACGPKVSVPPVAFEEDLEPRRVADVPPGDPLLAAARPVAPPGKGLRSGTIARDRLVAVLDAGPPSFLRQLEVAPKMSGDRFVGWELVQLVDRQSPLHDVDVVPGDVLLSINGQSISRPDQLQLVWDSLRTANQLTAQLWRGGAKLELAFAIEPRR